jgi:predicted pyridoxine 5'-phosphate oxidase superfamily flavin-nucleotide-binding protein
MQAGPGVKDRLGHDESEFIAERDSLYLATVSASGWPYIQHRGGPKGFLKVIDDHTLAFADFRGNKQFISTGNLGTDDRVALIMVDYPSRTRLKILGRTEVLEGEVARDWIEGLSEPSYAAAIERAFVIRVEVFDWNCPQHITPRFTADEIREALAPLEQRLEDLEKENQDLREKLQVTRT